MSILKYFGQPGNGDGDLNWGRVLAGRDDLPFRGRAPLMTEAEHESKVREFYDAKVAVFDLAKPDELAAYIDVIDRAANGFYRLTARDKVYDPETKSWRCYVEWLVPYNALVKGPSGRANQTQEPADEARSDTGTNA